MGAGAERARAIRLALVECKELELKIPELEADRFCFQIPLAKDKTGTAYRLSVSCPSDMMMSGYGYVETALFRKGGLCYVDELGYQDVCRHGDVKELIEEIQRLRKEIPLGDWSTMKKVVDEDEDQSDADP